MTKASLSLSKDYIQAFLGHVARPDEIGLHRAYELGRTALTGGLGVLEIAALHHEALGRLNADDTAAISRAQFARAAEFFAEALSPFEMSLRGYQETNSRLATNNKLLERAKAETEAANRELEAFSHSVAHDLRAPLHVIDGYCQALLEDCGDMLDVQGKTYLDRVCRSAERMGRLIEDLLKLSRITRADLHRQSIDLSQLAHSVIAALREREPHRHVDVNITDGIVANCDEGLLRVVLENLLGNAWKFTGKRPDARIEVSALMQNGASVYFVRDNGAGFDMAIAGKLFSAFERLHPSTEFEGTGIGLATVHRIIGRHGGRIWAESEMDRGASFFFSLDGSTE
jgi:light-regulated signal transduction histidine kinase (bacteriophytochrome)